MSKYFFKVNIFSSRRFFEVQCRTIFGTKRNITNFLIDSLRSCLELVLERSFRARLSSSTDRIYFLWTSLGALRFRVVNARCPGGGGGGGVPLGILGWGGGGGWRWVLLGILGWGVPRGSPNPDFISDQKMSFSITVFRPFSLRNYVIISKIGTQNKRCLKIHVKVVYYSFFPSFHLELK